MSQDDEITDNVKFWAVGEEELLRHTEIHEAIEDWWDQCYPEAVDPDHRVTVYGYAEMPLPSTDYLAFTVLDVLIERLDEEYSDPNGSPTDYTEKMKQAAYGFVDAVKEEYVSWACHVVTTKTVRVGDYLTDDQLAESKDGADYDCPKCHGTGDDESQPIAAAGRCGRCQGTGRLPLKEHPLREDTKDD